MTGLLAGYWRRCWRGCWPCVLQKGHRVGPWSAPVLITGDPVVFTGEPTREERDTDWRKRTIDVETEQPAAKLQSAVGGTRVKQKRARSLALS